MNKPSVIFPALVAQCLAAAPLPAAAQSDDRILNALFDSVRVNAEIVPR